MRLWIELFYDDVAAARDFWTRVMRFEVTKDEVDSPFPYAHVVRGEAELGLGHAWQPVDPSARGVPRGAEIVLETDDLAAEEAAIRAAGWPVHEEITPRPWGLVDFRLFDPGGYHLRVTTG